MPSKQVVGNPPGAMAPAKTCQPDTCRAPPPPPWLSLRAVRCWDTALEGAWLIPPSAGPTRLPLGPSRSPGDLCLAGGIPRRPPPPGLPLATAVPGPSPKGPLGPSPSHRAGGVFLAVPAPVACLDEGPDVTRLSGLPPLLPSRPVFPAAGPCL